MTTRRDALGGLGAALLAAFASQPSEAAVRPAYGGHLRLTLPIDTSRIDPHDEVSLTTRLLGSSLFDTLYARGGGTAPAYPTLASNLPQRSGATVTIELRPGLRSARGVVLDAKAVAAALERSRQRSRTLADVDRISARSALELALTTRLSEEALALRLAAPSSAIVPPGFDPARPDCTGALRSLGAGIQRLARNGWAPRGGSYVSEVTLTSADLRTSLRDFETRRSDLGFLGSGLHQSRGSARPFALGTLGWLVLLPGRRLGRFGAPGVLDQALGALRPADFAALGVELGSSRGAASWTGPPCSLLVPAEEPWLVAIAEEVARAWDSPRARVAAVSSPRAEFELRLDDENFDCALVFLGSAEPDAAHRALTALVGLPPPQRPLGALALEDAVRHLPLALLGRPVPRGFCSERLTDLVAPGALDLANVRFSG